jgi:NAD(P)-dependent dehydrogenase (short-subunit alcohol dehydrogenase family)
MSQPVCAPVCAIVGFGPGVSLGVARAFAQEGYRLAAVARSLDKLNANLEPLRQAGYSVSPFRADAGNAAELAEAFAQIRSQLGDPEVLVYNAVTFHPGRPSALTPEQLTADFQVNVVGALVAVQQVLPAMQAQSKGTILLTGGGLALNPWTDVSSLAIGKAGIRNLAFSLAQELAPAGIHVGTVTICGTVEPGTHFDPDAIAQAYLKLHQQTPDSFETEVVYR